MPLVYLIENRLNGKGYVGMTKGSLHHRWLVHKKDARRGRAGMFPSAIRKYGEDAWDMEVLETCATLDELRAAEVRWIARMGTKHDTGDGYNLTDGGDGCLNPSASTREKMSLSARSRRRDSPETRARKSAASSGRVRGPPSEATREKLRAASLGKKASEETKKKMSASHAGGWPRNNK